MFGWNEFKAKIIAEKLASREIPPVSVTSVEAKTVEWPVQIMAVGQVVTSQGVEVTPQVAGQVLKVEFASGQMVNEGDVLIQMDDRLDRATLEQNRSSLNLAELDYERKLDLLASNNVSQSDVDNARTRLINQQAAVDATLTKIDYMAVKAPFTGRIGIRQVDVGDYLSPGTPLASLQDLTKLYIDFSVPAVHLPDLKVGQKVEVRSDAYPGHSFNATLYAIDPLVDSTSRNVDLRAELDASSDKLLPGMFVELSVITDSSVNVISLPAVAINFSLYGDTVFVVKDATAKQVADAATDGRQSPVDGVGLDKNYKSFPIDRREITVGLRKNGLIGVVDGLKDGDVVITSNLHQLNNSRQVIVNNAVAPSTGIPKGD